MASELQRVELSPLDQIMPRIYSRLIFPFIFDDKNVEIAARNWQMSLQKLTREIPILTWNVVLSPDNGGKVELRPQPDNSRQLLNVKDLRSETSGWTLSMKNLRDAGYPMAELNGDILAPLQTMPDPEAPAPVFAAQLSCLRGGALLCVAFHHSIFDANGFGTVIKTWATFCGQVDQQTSEPTREAPLYINHLDLDRGQLTGSGQIEDATEFPEYKLLQPPKNVTSSDASPGQPFTLPAMSACTLTFSMSSLSGLKKHVNDLVNLHQNSGLYASTNDALSALLWQRISFARFSSSLPQPSDKEVLPSQSMLGFAVNGRPRLIPPLSANYLGNVNLYATSSLHPYKLVGESSLGDVALSIRRAIAAIDDKKIRHTVSFINQLQDVRLLVPGFNNFLGPDLAITSWADLGLNGIDWGKAMGGKAGSVRIPHAEFDGLCIILPRLEDGSLEVVVGLKTEHLEVLQRDQFLSQFAAIR